MSVNDYVILPFGFKMGCLMTQQTCHHCRRFSLDNSRLFWKDDNAAPMPATKLRRAEDTPKYDGPEKGETRFYCGDCCKKIAILAF
jgi:hypothetical protein